MDKIKCPYCEGYAFLEDNVKIYVHRSYGLSFICENYPKCDTYVGVHKGNLNPLGSLANKELRAWRMKCHSEFDPIWKNKHLSRPKAYKALAHAMKIEKKDCHFAMFNVEQCKKALELIPQIKYDAMKKVMDAPAPIIESKINRSIKYKKAGLT